MDPDILPPLRDVIARHDLGARKNLGQHFLLDLNITDKIVRGADVQPGDSVIEVGPGPGGLTRSLLRAGAFVTVVERDARCLPALKEIEQAYNDRLRITIGDALSVDETDLFRGHGTQSIKIVANLPYYVSTPLLIKWLKLRDGDQPVWGGMALMFQREVADRILAKPGAKTYGRLSVLAQAASTPSLLMHLPARAFTPPPKVESSVVLFEPKALPADLLAALERVTAAAFSQRRKMLRTTLKPIFGADTERFLSTLGVTPTERAENLTVGDFIGLSKHALVDNPTR
ncbi:MAG: 16S rRNA (adenine(1518)-N(6)/adenine(1519)-N(6))-dimethyltransferase RsmA [Pseudomonadota bacterium]